MRRRLIRFIVVCLSLASLACEDPYVRGELGKVEYAVLLLEECGVGCRPAPIAPFQEFAYLVRRVDRILTAVSSDEDVAHVERVTPQYWQGELEALQVYVTSQAEGEGQIELYDGDELCDVLVVTVRADGLR